MEIEDDLINPKETDFTQIVKKTHFTEDNPHCWVIGKENDFFSNYSQTFNDFRKILSYNKNNRKMNIMRIDRQYIFNYRIPAHHLFNFFEENEEILQIFFMPLSLDNEMVNKIKNNIELIMNHSYYKFAQEIIYYFNNSILPKSKIFFVTKINFYFQIKKYEQFQYLEEILMKHVFPQKNVHFSIPNVNLNLQIIYQMEILKEFYVQFKFNDEGDILNCEFVIKREINDKKNLHKTFYYLLTLINKMTNLKFCIFNGNLNLDEFCETRGEFNLIKDMKTRLVFPNTSSGSQLLKFLDSGFNTLNKLCLPLSQKINYLYINHDISAKEIEKYFNFCDTYKIDELMLNFFCGIKNLNYFRKFPKYNMFDDMLCNLRDFAFLETDKKVPKVTLNIITLANIENNLEKIFYKILQNYQFNYELNINFFIDFNNDKILLYDQKYLNTLQVNSYTINSVEQFYSFYPNNDDLKISKKLEMTNSTESSIICGWGQFSCYHPKPLLKKENKNSSSLTYFICLINCKKNSNNFTVKLKKAPIISVIVQFIRHGINLKIYKKEKPLITY